MFFRYNGLRFRFLDADRWITVKPNGPENKGRPVRIDAETGIIKGGMGGKFTGQHIKSAHNGGKAAAPAASAAMSAPAPAAAKKALPKAPVAPHAAPAAEKPKTGQALLAKAMPDFNWQHLYGQTPEDMKDLADKLVSAAFGGSKPSAAQQKKIDEILSNADIDAGNAWGVAGTMVESAAEELAALANAPGPVVGAVSPTVKPKVKVKPAPASAAASKAKAKVKVKPSKTNVKPAAAPKAKPASAAPMSPPEILETAIPNFKYTGEYCETPQEKKELADKLVSLIFGGKTLTPTQEKKIDDVFMEEDFGGRYAQDAKPWAIPASTVESAVGKLWYLAKDFAKSPDNAETNANAKTKVKVKPASAKTKAKQGNGLSAAEIISKHFPDLANEDYLWIDDHWDNPKKSYEAFKKDVIESAIGSEKPTPEDMEHVSDVLSSIGFDNAVDGVDAIDVADIEKAIKQIKSGLEILHNKSKSPAKPAMTGPTGTAQLSSILKQLHEAKSRGNDYHSSGVLLGEMIRDSTPVRPDWAVQTDPDYQYVHYDGQTSYGYESHEFAQPTSQLSDGETLSLENYSGDGYHDINDYYRKKKKYDELDPTTQEDLANLEAAFDKAETTRDMTLVRGISLGALAACLDADGNFKDDAYLSCSALAANSFAASGMDVAVVYRVPAGAKALSLDGVSQFPGESEILLNRGTEGKLVGLEYDPTYKKYVAYVNVID